jgi:glucosamine--fructose-6-phosphate aminotransferase (isomerizing)
MCGIVGYIGPKKAIPLILDGLKRLEYRGYDSAGIAVVDQRGMIDIRRASGNSAIWKSPCGTPLSKVAVV